MHILFVHSGNEQFVRIDRDLLCASFIVKDFYTAHKFPSDLFQYWREIKKADVVFCWFASWNSFWALLFARFFRKGSILVIGGYDLANLPEANYGHQRSGAMKWISRSAMKLPTQLFTNSSFSQKEAVKNAHIPLQRVHVIYHGVPDPFGKMPTMPRERMALTVGKVDWPNLKRKGIESFVRAAALLPDVKFVVVGVWADKSIEYLRSIATKNVIFTGHISEENLLEYYRKASVYVQGSLHEGFGLSVAEAMLGGNIPVTTRAGSLPEVVDKCGFYCDSPDPAEIARVVEMALASSLSLREKARQQILIHFPMSQRGKLLDGLVQSVGSKSIGKD